MLRCYPVIIFIDLGLMHGNKTPKSVEFHSSISVCISKLCTHAAPTFRFCDSKMMCWRCKTSITGSTEVPSPHRLVAMLHCSWLNWIFYEFRANQLARYQLGNWIGLSTNSSPNDVQWMLVDIWFRSTQRAHKVLTKNQNNSNTWQFQQIWTLCVVHSPLHSLRFMRNHYGKFPDYWRFQLHIRYVWHFK